MTDAGRPEEGAQQAAPSWGPDEVTARLAGVGYLSDRRLATATAVALRLGRPLFLEGEAGVGKTELARALAAALGARLIRLQCYEGIDLAHAAYEWDYGRQLLHIRLLEAGSDRAAAERDLFGRSFLLRRPLLDAVDNDDPVPPVLLIDEVDRADEEFEAFLLEVLGDFAITIPELGTVRAKHPPVVVLTGNRTREVHDALKRRCLYHWIDYGDLEHEVSVVRVRAPEVAERLARQVALAVQRLRALDLYKLPGVAETVDWARAVNALGVGSLDETTASDTLGAVLKHQDDIERARAVLTDLLLPPTP